MFDILKKRWQYYTHARLYSRCVKIEIWRIFGQSSISPNYRVAKVSLHMVVITQESVLCLIYMHSPLGAAHPRVSCVYIKQSALACVITLTTLIYTIIKKIKDLQKKYVWITIKSKEIRVTNYISNATKVRKLV